MLLCGGERKERRRKEKKERKERRLLSHSFLSSLSSPSPPHFAPPLFPPLLHKSCIIHSPLLYRRCCVSPCLTCRRRRETHFVCPFLLFNPILPGKIFWCFFRGGGHYCPPVYFCFCNSNAAETFQNGTYNY